MKKAIVVGSGAGGTAVARELQGHYEVTIMEAGSCFKPFTFNLAILEKLKKTGILLDERLIQLFFKQIEIKKTEGLFAVKPPYLPSTNKIILVKGIGSGGSTPLSTGSCLSKNLKRQ